ncbi:putative brevis radix (BRX) domain-containing protein [Helianthus annuus]|nr:putative brevis radix (BRX) domain-containing protein [Helianthus annuus]
MSVDILRHQYTIQETELKKSRKAAQEAMVLAAEESAKCKASKDVIKIFDCQERLPPGSYDFESIESTNGMEPNGVLQYADVNGDDKPLSNGSLGPAETITRTEEPMRYNSRSPKSRTFNKNEYLNGDCAPPHDEDNDFKPRSPVSAVGTPAITTNHVEAEWIEQYEPGVYITLVALRDGTRDLKRVRFSRRRFGEHQAETWWSENREHVYERYNVRGSTKSSVSSTTASRRSGESVAPPAKY